jgi:hypothetical protein
VSSPPFFEVYDLYNAEDPTCTNGRKKGLNLSKAMVHTFLHRLPACNMYISQQQTETEEGEITVEAAELDNGSICRVNIQNRLKAASLTVVTRARNVLFIYLEFSSSSSFSSGQGHLAEDEEAFLTHDR